MELPHHPVWDEQRTPQQEAAAADPPPEAEVAAFVQALIEELVNLVPRFMVHRFPRAEKPEGS
jgi:hypothetical protein